MIRITRRGPGYSAASAGLRRGPRRERIFTTITFIELAAGTPGRAFAEFHEIARRELSVFEGREIKHDGALSVTTFDVPVDAVRFAFAVRDAMNVSGMAVRAAVHTGEFELRSNDVCGDAVHICRRLLDEASDGDVVATRVVAELAGGSGVPFERRGKRELRGVAGSWHVFTAADASALAS